MQYVINEKQIHAHKEGIETQLRITESKTYMYQKQGYVLSIVVHVSIT